MTSPDRNSALLVIPCYQERERLPVFLENIAQELASFNGKIHICVVDDGSGQDTSQWLRTYISNIQLRYNCILPPLIIDKNIGKGGAIYHGWKTYSGYDWLAFADADGATPPREIARIFRHILSSPSPASAYFACRIVMLGRTVRRSWPRHIIGRIFATMTTSILRIGVYDSQCGFKILQAVCFDEIAGSLSEMRFSFDVDLLLQLYIRDMSIQEMPVDWTDIAGSKVHLIRDSIQMLRALLKLRRRHLSLKS